VGVLRRSATASRKLMAKQGFRIVDPDLRRVLASAGVSVVWSPTRTHAGKLVKQPFAPAWAVDSGLALDHDDMPSAEITRLLSLGEGAEELERAVALAALAHCEPEGADPFYEVEADSMPVDDGQLPLEFATRR
jgi:hypothetical protein